MRFIVIHTPTGIELNLDADDYGHPDGREIVRSLHGHMSRSDPKLICAKHNAPLYLQIRHHRKHGPRLFGIHFDARYDSHISTAMSDEHKRQTEYVVRAAEDAGYRTSTEVSLPTKVKPDAVVYGSNDVGIEVQRSHLTESAAIGRTRKAVNAGLLASVWFSDRDPIRPPSWFWSVPSIGMNMLPWDIVPPKGSATVATGLRIVRPIKCVPGEVGNCPEKGGRPCGRFHPHHEPWIGMAVDDVAAGVPGGQIVPLMHKGSVLLVSEESKATYEELTGRPAELWMTPTSEALEVTTGSDDGPVECVSDIPEALAFNNTPASDATASTLERSQHGGRWAAPEVLNWSDRTHWNSGKQGRCILCHKPALLVDEHGRPCHKTCSEKDRAIGTKTPRALGGA